MSEVLFKGDVSVRETWESGSLTYGDRKEKTFVKRGKAEELLLLMPVQGDVYEPGWLVTSATLTPEHGGMARLVVSCHRNRCKVDGSGGEEEGDAPTVVIEVAMAQLEKPLMAKSDWSGYAPQIEMWQASPAEIRAQKKYVDGENTYDLTGGAANVADLLMRGVESYLVYSPVVRVQTTTSAAPKDVGKDAGKRCAPPADALAMLAGTWEWLKTGDTATKDAEGNYTRSEEWTGADAWEPLLYEEAK